MVKICRTCQSPKPLSEFWGQKTMRDGLQSECKTCMKNRNNAWQRKNKARRHKEKLDGIYMSRRRDPIKSWLKGVRDRARSSGIPFSLTIDDFVVPAVCPVLGIPLKSMMGNGGRYCSKEQRDAAPSIDRIDNKKGYHRDNIVIVSYRANRFKSDASLEELKKLVAFYEGRSRNDSTKISVSGRIGDGHRNETVSMSGMQHATSKEERPLPLGNQ